MPDNLTNALEQRIAAALQTPPPIHIPEHFAARVAAEAYARFGAPPQIRPARHFGTLSIRIALAVLLVAMLLLARHPGLPPAASLILEATLSAEFIALTLYLAHRRSPQEPFSASAWFTHLFD